MTSDNTHEPVTKKSKVDDVVMEEESLQAAISTIEGIEDTLNNIETEQSNAIIKLEQEYVAKKIPYYKKRAAQVKTIPKFWATALMNHPQLACMIEETDEPAFDYLESINIDPVMTEEKAQDANGREVLKSLNSKIIFEFRENPYFENTELIKCFYTVGQDIVSEGPEIKWKPDNNLIEAAKKNVKDGAGDCEDDEANESFFAWFGDHADAGNDETADVIKDDLFNYALNYYLNEDATQEGDEEIDLHSSEEENDD